LAQPDRPVTLWGQGPFQHFQLLKALARKRVCAEEEMLMLGCVLHISTEMRDSRKSCWKAFVSPKRLPEEKCVGARAVLHSGAGQEQQRFGRRVASTSVNQGITGRNTSSTVPGPIFTYLASSTARRGEN